MELIIFLTIVVLLFVSVYIPHKSTYNLSWHTRLLVSLLMIYIPYKIIIWIHTLFIWLIQ